MLGDAPALGTEGEGACGNPIDGKVLAAFRLRKGSFLVKLLCFGLGWVISEPPSVLFSRLFSAICLYERRKLVKADISRAAL